MHNGFKQFSLTLAGHYLQDIMGLSFRHIPLNLELFNRSNSVPIYPVSYAIVFDIVFIISVSDFRLVLYVHSPHTRIEL